MRLLDASVDQSQLTKQVTRCIVRSGFWPHGIFSFFFGRSVAFAEHEWTSDDLDTELAAVVHSIRISYPSDQAWCLSVTMWIAACDAEGRPRLFWWEVQPQFLFYQVISISAVGILRGKLEKSCKDTEFVPPMPH